MNRLLIAVIALMVFAIGPARAEIHTPETYYSGSARSPYPPGCATVPVRQLELYGDNVALVHEGTTDLDQVSAEPLPVRIQIFRVACAEAGRSVILVQFGFLGWPGDVPLPDFVGIVGDSRLPFQLKPEPNTHGQTVYQQAISQRTFGDYSNGWFTEQIGWNAWLFVLDVNPIANGSWGPDTSDFYNGEFALWMITGQRHIELASIPATRAVLARNPVLPLNGRLSGTWIEPGTRDQGFLLSVSTPVPPTVHGGAPENADLLVFLAWYTFDASGRMLWLTAQGTAPQGSHSVDLEIVQVDGGSFMGSEQAQRAIVGSGRLRARNCNLLGFDYELNSLGLGSGKVSLTRLYELEIAGYNCRDYPARLEGLYGSQGD